jgi:formamidopyrimidine-DNA glycosylase
MPELPEVETVRRSLADRVVGTAIHSVEFRNFPGVVGSMSQEVFSALVVGKRFAGIDRRGKHLWLGFENGNGLFIHLMMTGQLLLLRPDAEPVRFEHLRLQLDNGWAVAYADQRKFGRVLRLTDDEWDAIDRRIGPEPLEADFTGARLYELTRDRHTAIKAFLLDQRKVAGVGNIYADEALYRAKLHPARATGSLSEVEAERLRDAVREVLSEGLERKGTTLSNYRDANGDAGTNATNLRVYGRGGSGICDECGATLVRLIVAQRGTTICPTCQPAG